MNFIDLKYILTIYQENNFTRAAQKLYVSQPALSQRVQKVENELQTILFIRTATGLEATAEGKMFADMALKILETYEEFTSNIVKSIEDTSSKLRIGLPPNQSRTMAPILAEKFFSDHPGTQLYFKSENSDRIEAQIESGELDCGVVHYPAFNSKLSYKTIYKIPFRIYLRKNSPIAKHAEQMEGCEFPTIALSHFKDEPLGVTLKGTRTRAVIDNSFQRENVVPNIVQEMSSFESLINLADSGLCSILQPHSMEINQTLDHSRIFNIGSKHSIFLEVALAYRVDSGFLKTYESVYKILADKHSSVNYADRI